MNLTFRLRENAAWYETRCVHGNRLDSHCAGCWEATLRLARLFDQLAEQSEAQPEEGA